MGKYWVVRCPNCHQFNYTDKYGKWKLCPVCGEIISTQKVPIYLEVDEYSEAEHLIAAVEQYLAQTGRADLHPEEVAVIREKYQEWLKKG